MLLETVSVQCPYCWEILEIQIDTTLGGQEYVEDCSVCCHPILVHVEQEDELSVTVSKE
jgi:hypothetical protein